jgi:hypothetical protein
MKVTHALVFPVALLVALCMYAPPAHASGTCVHCSCSGGTCTCPTCLDSAHYPGFCSTIGCQSGHPCCFVTGCGDCTCIQCTAAKCVSEIPGCTIDGCPFSPGVVEATEANNHLQPWMVDETLSTQLAAYSKTWSVVVARLQHDFNDTTQPLATRRKMLLPEIAHVEFGFPEYQQSVVIETKYSAQKGGWVIRLIRGLKEDQSTANVLVIVPTAWSLHREEPTEHIADGKIKPMPNVLDFPKDENVETQAVH